MSKKSKIQNEQKKKHRYTRLIQVIITSRSSDELIGDKARFDKLYAMIDDPNFIALDGS